MPAGRGKSEIERERKKNTDPKEVSICHNSLNLRKEIREKVTKENPTMVEAIACSGWSSTLDLEVEPVEVEE